ncbi:LLM class flavin-dependent oxidoreductase [Rhizobium rhizogenes]|uniref:Monooxygenase n=2 Tax=Rhizobium/Agrobacterium group TaxID=227290 RepID=A0AB36EIR3_AGRTU|nr:MULTISPECIES: LLM class flavin-dependent oxidoreductase [Rhizobium/Agrobacterium group]MDQ1219763.1 FMN-dependent oxidoreductase (nitrilotriacetate monooxygenase family) [Agrobacterium sp. SORGH_AS_0745]OCJ37694.1 monooxygenase [Agrobacterium tumefaciens]TRA89013.1 LLM class flavin-dependent oxidoreductase [Rhizobium rhizogenes]
MSRKSEKLVLNAFIYPGGHHEAAWRHPESEPLRVTDIRLYQDIALKAEAAKLDAIFFADAPVLDANIRYAARHRLEPITMLAALAAVTEKIGFIATASTTYYEPYNLARLFASVDHISRGRVGWNIVTTSADAAAGNFNLQQHPPHADRYRQATEFVDVVTKLWDSWEDDAIVADKESGLFADTDRIHPASHEGEFYRVRGALNLPRSPQGRPVYVQAGSSEDGRGFAARYAEAIFTAHQTLESARSFYSDIKRRVAATGRNPAHVKILPGISPFIASTEEEARKLEASFNDLIQPAFSLGQLQRITGIDLSSADLDQPLPKEAVEATRAQADSSRHQLVLDVIDRENPTIRQLLHRLAGGRGHKVISGTPEQVADWIETWFREGAADGFNIMPPWLNGGFDIFVDEVVPILKQRGLFREDYEGDTLRDHYGLPRPENIHTTRELQRERA